MSVDPQPVPLRAEETPSGVEELAQDLRQAREAAERLAEDVVELRRRLAAFEVETARRLALLDDDRAALEQRLEARLAAGPP